MMVLSGLKGEIGMSRKSVTANIAQSHIYGQAHIDTVSPLANAHE